MTRKRLLKRMGLTIGIICIVCGLVALIINAGMYWAGKKRILSEAEAAALEDVDCILVLGCQVHEDGTPSHMLEDRLLRSVAIYELCGYKLLMSGDHGQVRYDEVTAMKKFATDRGIASQDVFMDHAGFSTYESMYRAKAIFGADKVVIVTQEYHLYRALHIAKALGIEAYGVAAEYRTYGGQWLMDAREILARVKDFGTGIFKPKPTYLGETIDITGNGDVTND